MTSLLAGLIGEALRTKVAPETVVVTADPFFAAALQAELPNVRCTDIFTWASEYTHSPKPTAIDLYEVYDKALHAVGLSRQGGVTEAWEAAQRLGRDWEEVLLGTLDFAKTQEYWKLLADHRQLQEVFRLYPAGEVPTWLRLLPLPHQQGSHLTGFWKKLLDFINLYQRELRNRRKSFAEEALQRIYSSLKNQKNKSASPVFFVHLYTAYPLIDALLREAQSVGWLHGGWDVKLLQQTLPEIWSDYAAPSIAAPPPAELRPITLRLGSTLVEVITGAAEAIKKYLCKHPSARVAIWCEGEAAVLLRHLLEQADPRLGAQISPRGGTLWETTRIGAELQPFLLEGLRKGWSAWPEVAAGDSPAEKLAESLYSFIRRQSSSTDPTAWQLLFSLLQQDSPMEGAFSSQVRVYLGRLSQLAGGQYDALFLVAPPAEPLGSWERPSFWVPSLRNQFFPRSKHHQLRWRLMSILLWGSREIFLWRQSAQEYQTPIEELLHYIEPLGLHQSFRKPEISPPPPPVLPRPTPLEIQEGDSTFSLSPAAVAQLFVCPRRFYWRREQDLKELRPTEVAQLGTYLHKLVETTFFKKQNRAIPLRRVGYLLSWRRWYYRLGRFSRLPVTDPDRWDRRYRFLRPFLARSTESVGYALYELLSGESVPEFTRIPWRRWAQAPGRYRFKSENKLSISLKNTFVSGRIDLLVEEEASHKTGRGQRILIDFKPSVSHLPATPDFLSELRGDWQGNSEGFSSPKDFSAEAFQLLSYAYFLQKQGTPVDIAGLVSLWWRPKPRSSKGEAFSTSSASSPPAPYVSYGADVLQGCVNSLEKLWEWLDTELPKALPKGTSAFPQTSDLTLCKRCSYALLCDRLPPPE